MLRPSDISPIFLDVIFSTRIRNNANPRPVANISLPEKSFMCMRALYAITSSTNEYINENLYGRSLGKWKPCHTKLR